MGLVADYKRLFPALVEGTIQLGNNAVLIAINPHMESSNIFCKGWFCLSIGLFSLCFGGRFALADWHGRVNFLSDYIYRGYSKNRGNPLVQGHIDYQDDSGWFGGLSVSQVRFDDGKNVGRASVEIKPHLGWTWPVTAGWRAELAASAYIYDNKIFDHYANYAEVYISAHYQNWLSARVAIAPNAYQRQANVLNYELNYRRDILDTVQFSAGLGYNQAGALLGQDYFYWNTGVSWFLTNNLSVDFRYVDANLGFHESTEYHHDEFYPRPQDNKYLFSVTFGF